MKPEVLRGAPWRGEARPRIPAPRRPGDIAGPVLLAALLAAAFVPSVLTEFDASSVLRVLEAALAALATPDPRIEAADPARSDPSGAPVLVACSQVSDSPLLLLGFSVPISAFLSSEIHRSLPAAPRRTLVPGASPRAPPLSSLGFSPWDGSLNRAA